MIDVKREKSKTTRKEESDSEDEWDHDEESNT